MPDFRIQYTYAAPTPYHPEALVRGATDVTAVDADEARYNFTGRKAMKNVKDLRILMVEEIL